MRPSVRLFYTDVRHGRCALRTYIDFRVFDHRYFSWKQRITNDEVRNRIFRDLKSSRRLNQIILGTRLRWLGHVLRMNSSRLPKKFSLAEPKLGWKRLRGGQVMTWHQGDERINKKVSHCWFLSFTWLGTERPTTRMAEYPRGDG